MDNQKVHNEMRRSCGSGVESRFSNHEVIRGQIYESIDQKYGGIILRVKYVRDNNVFCEQVHRRDDQWEVASKKLRRRKLASLTPERKTHRLIDYQPQGEFSQWRREASVRIIDNAGEALAARRRAYGLGTKDFSQLIGCTQRNVQYWEKNQREVTPAVIALLELLNVSDERTRRNFALMRGVSIQGEPA